MLDFSTVRLFCKLLTACSTRAGLKIPCHEDTASTRVGPSFPFPLARYISRGLPKVPRMVGVSE